MESARWPPRWTSKATQASDCFSKSHFGGASKTSLLLHKLKTIPACSSGRVCAYPCLHCLEGKTQMSLRLTALCSSDIRSCVSALTWALEKIASACSLRRWKWAGSRVCSRMQNFWLQRSLRDSWSQLEPRHQILPDSRQASSGKIVSRNQQDLQCYIANNLQCITVIE